MPASNSAADSGLVRDALSRVKAAIHTHASRHAAGGPDAITPESIRAVPLARPDTVDADASIASGSYRAVRTNVTNMGSFPAEWTSPVGYLTSWRFISDDYVRQTFVSQFGDHVWSRGKYGTLGPWKRLVTDDDPRLLDTGWRKFPTASDVPIESGGLYLRRVNERVYLSAQSLKLVSSVSGRTDLIKSTDNPIPVGFRPNTFHIQGRFTQSNAITTAYDVTVWSTHSFSVHGRTSLSSNTWTSGWQADHALHGEISWSTTNTWPTTLPGTPA